MERFFFLDDADRALSEPMRRAHNRLGFAVQMATVRFLGVFLDDPADEPGYRRQIKSQANFQEGRHSLARKIFHGRSGQLYQRYQDGMEDQIGALGLVLNALVQFNTRYMDAAVNQLRADGFDVRDAARSGCHRRGMTRSRAAGWEDPGATARRYVRRRA
ncbi:Tn3 family transposase [Streptomyces sp. SID685]|nr:Tn3 family transposase [Streptomyces sp. SID685]